MEQWMNEYLTQIELHLRPLPVGEQVDIIAEIKSEILESYATGKTQEEILARLGAPKELAQGYLGEAIVKSPSFTFRKLGAVTAFYSLAGAAWLFVLPVTSLCGAGFMIGGALAPLAGLLKFAAHLLGFEVPWVVVQFGGYTPGPGLTLVYSLVMGALLFAAGHGLWRLTVKIIKKISAAKARLGS